LSEVQKMLEEKTEAQGRMIKKVGNIPYGGEFV
jgi:hypothetical protein